MGRIFKLTLILIPFLIACDWKTINDSEQINELKLRKVTQNDAQYGTYHYDENEQLIKKLFPEARLILYTYDSHGNAIKRETYSFDPQAREYKSCGVITYSFDTKRNPFYQHDTRYGMIQFLSPNNILGWKSYSPETGQVVSKSSFLYEYNSRDYPINATETVISPLTDAQPGATIHYTQYEYTQ